jgi:hypothetical protein
MPFTTAAGPRQRSHSRVRVPGTRDHILLSRVRDSPNWRARSSYLYPQEQGGPDIPQALSSLSVAFYDSQGYGGGIRTGLHTGFTTLFWKFRSIAAARTTHTQKKQLYCKNR